MTELDELFSGVYEEFKSYVEKLILIRNLLPWKITESMGYDVVLSYEWQILSENKYWSARENVDKIVL